MEDSRKNDAAGVSDDPLDRWCQTRYNKESTKESFSNDSTIWDEDCGDRDSKKGLKDVNVDSFVELDENLVTADLLDQDVQIENMENVSVPSHMTRSDNVVEYNVVSELFGNESVQVLSPHCSMLATQRSVQVWRRHRDFKSLETRVENIAASNPQTGLVALLPSLEDTFGLLGQVRQPDEAEIQGRRKAIETYMRALVQCPGLNECADAVMQSFPMLLSCYSCCA